MGHAIHLQVRSCRVELRGRRGGSEGGSWKIGCDAKDLSVLVLLVMVMVVVVVVMVVMW